MENFSLSGLRPEIIRAVTELGFVTPTPVQQQTIPFLLENTTDLVALAQTGTGKTAAFGLPILDKIDSNNRLPQVLVL
ncbi:MAG TPA: DEAD/DEAH box helicase, partial [Bacteroidales bacterium]|nr:DEAD/DEAH box helicase [Bacteroidales bacterium]